MEIAIAVRNCIRTRLAQHWNGYSWVIVGL